jgi:hypothetical protein
VNKIEWQDAPYNTKYGAVGGLQLFAITYKSRSADPNWLMRCELPGMAGQEWKDDDERVLRELAVQVLDAWLQRVFGIQPGTASAADAAFDVWLTGDGPLQPGYDPESPTQLKTRADVVVHLAEAYTAGWLARGGETS